MQHWFRMYLVNTAFPYLSRPKMCSTEGLVQERLFFFNTLKIYLFCGNVLSQISELIENRCWTMLTDCRALGWAVTTDHI
jgi:hypothetical protein